MPPPPPPPNLQELCHYQGDCSHHPVIDTLHTNSSIVHVITITITTITIILVVAVSCIILLRYKFLDDILFYYYDFFLQKPQKKIHRESTKCC